MSGPCMCGDPYCGSCGTPGLAEAEAAEEKALSILYDANLSPAELVAAAEIGVAAIKAARKIKQDLAAERAAERALADAAERDWEVRFMGSGA